MQGNITPPFMQIIQTRPIFQWCTTSKGLKSLVSWWSIPLKETNFLQFTFHQEIITTFNGHVHCTVQGMGMAKLSWLYIRAQKYVYFNTFPPAPFLYVKRLAYWPFKDYKRQVKICNIKLWTWNRNMLCKELHVKNKWKTFYDAGLPF